MKITKGEWRDWMDHPVTKVYFDTLRSDREEALRRLAAGMFADEPGKQSVVIGMIGAMTKILDADFEGEDE